MKGLFWARSDAVLCLAVPTAARFTVVVVDHGTGVDLAMPDVVFRWRSSAEAFIREHTVLWAHRGAQVDFRVRELGRGVGSGC